MWERGGHLWRRLTAKTTKRMPRPSRSCTARAAEPDACGRPRRKIARTRACRNRGCETQASTRQTWARGHLTDIDETILRSAFQSDPANPGKRREKTTYVGATLRDAAATWAEEGRRILGLVERSRPRPLLCNQYRIHTAASPACFGTWSAPVTLKSSTETSAAAEAAVMSLGRNTAFGNDWSANYSRTIRLASVACPCHVSSPSNSSKEKLHSGEGNENRSSHILPLDLRAYVLRAWTWSMDLEVCQILNRSLMLHRVYIAACYVEMWEDEG